MHTDYQDEYSPIINLIGAIEQQAREDIEEAYSHAIQRRTACEKGKRIPMMGNADDYASAVWWLDGRRCNSRVLSEMIGTVKGYLQHCRNCEGVRR